MRRAAGFKLNKVEYYLRRFVQFSSNEGQAYISVQTAIEWARQGTSPAERSFRLKTVAGFARYLSAEDPQHEVPPDDVFGGYQIRRRIPFIFTVEDVNRLVEAASLLGPPGALANIYFFVSTVRRSQTASRRARRIKEPRALATSPRQTSRFHCTD